MPHVSINVNWGNSPGASIVPGLAFPMQRGNRTAHVFLLVSLQPLACRFRTSIDRRNQRKQDGSRCLPRRQGASSFIMVPAILRRFIANCACMAVLTCHPASLSGPSTRSAITALVFLGMTTLAAQPGIAIRYHTSLRAWLPYPIAFFSGLRRAKNAKPAAKERPNISRKKSCLDIFSQNVPKYPER